MSAIGKIIKGIGIAGTAFAGLAVVVNKLESKKNAAISHEQGFYEKYIKRPQDLVCATAATIVLSPVMLGTALMVRIKLGTPVVFSQDRPGLNDEIFRLYKFRTMTEERDDEGELLPDEYRLTEFGKFLRASSLDELPELFNIIKGDMSIVGPRPLLVEYLPRYNEHQARRHEVRSGITGLAQINGRNSLTWEDKFDFDVEYVDNVTLREDWKIIFKTIVTVLRREGINSETSATMEDFLGSGSECDERKFECKESCDKRGE